MDIAFKLLLEITLLYCPIQQSSVFPRNWVKSWRTKTQIYRTKPIGCLIFCKISDRRLHFRTNLYFDLKRMGYHPKFWEFEDRTNKNQKSPMYESFLFFVNTTINNKHDLSFEVRFSIWLVTNHFQQWRCFYVCKHSDFFLLPFSWKIFSRVIL